MIRPQYPPPHDAALNAELELYEKAALTIARGYSRAERLMLLHGEHYTAQSFAEMAQERRDQAAGYRRQLTPPPES